MSKKPGVWKLNNMPSDYIHDPKRKEGESFQDYKKRMAADKRLLKKRLNP
jgi:hypothetical protein